MLSEPPASRRRALAAAALLVALTLLAYLPVLRAGFIWDDDAYLTENPLLTAPGGLRRIWLEPGATPQYYPLTFTSFWLERRLWGLEPRAYHLVNVGLHGANAVLLALVLRRLAVPGALAAAAIFAVHPVHVESVAWVSERKNVLSGLFYLAAVLVFCRFARPGAVRGARRRDHALVLGLFALALAAKTVTATLPLALALLIWHQRGRLPASRALALAAMLLLGAAAGLTTAWVEKHVVGAAGEVWALAPLERLLLAGRALWFYAGKLVWPVDLIFFYPRFELDSTSPLAYLYPASALALLAALWIFRARLGRGPLAAALYFVVTLSPALGFFAVYPMRYSHVADHFQYLASIGVIVPLAALVALRVAGAAGQALLAVAIAILATLTAVQAGNYRDAETLWRRTIAANPAAWMAHNNLGSILLARGDLAGATRHYQESHLLSPSHPEVQTNLGVIRLRQGRLREAHDHFRTALALAPDHWLARFDLATVLLSLGETAEARSHLERAVALAPDFAEARHVLGRLLLEQGEGAAALPHLETLARLEPRSFEAHLLLGRAHFAAGRAARAVRELLETLRIQPAALDALRLLAWIRATELDPALADPEAAIALAERACSLTGRRDAESLAALAAAEAALGRFAAAGSTAAEAERAARDAGDVTLAERLATRAARYRRGEAVRDP